MAGARQETRRLSDEMVCELKKEIGVLCGRMESIEHSVDDIGGDIKTLIKEIAISAETHRLVVQHDKRLSTLEQRCSARSETVEAMREHMKDNKPVDMDAWRDGKIAAVVKYAWWVALGVMVTKLAEKVF